MGAAVKVFWLGCSVRVLLRVGTGWYVWLSWRAYTPNVCAVL